MGDKIGGLGEIGMMAGGGILGGIMGGLDDNRQYNQAEKLQALQIKGQKEMAEYNRNIAMKMWDDTNVGAQVKHMNDAGLSVGLMYKGTGQGGTTQSNAGAVQGQSADGRRTTGAEAMQMGLNTAMQQAQINLAESQANKNNVEATKIGGVDTDEATQRIANLVMGETGQFLENELKSVTLRVQELAEKEGMQYENLKSEMTKLKADMQKAVNDANISTNTYDDVIGIVRQDLINAGLQGELIRANINLTEEETKAISKKLAQIDENLGYEARKTAVLEAFKDFNTGLGAEIERATRIGGNVVNMVTDVIPQTRTVKKTFDTFKNDKDGNETRHYGSETTKSKGR